NSSAVCAGSSAFMSYVLPAGHARRDSLYSSHRIARLHRRFAAGLMGEARSGRCSSMAEADRKLNHVWRIFATGVAFVLFGIGALFVSVTIFPLLRLSTWNADTAHRRIQHAMQLTFRVFIEVTRLLGILTYRV